MEEAEIEVANVLLLLKAEGEELLVDSIAEELLDSIEEELDNIEDELESIADELEGVPLADPDMIRCNVVSDSHETGGAVGHWKGCKEMR